MRYCDSIFGHLLEPISRRHFDAIVDRHDGNAYDKILDSWTHLVSLICAQLSSIDSLRGLESLWRANAHQHYHLGVSNKLARSTLSDANTRRPLAVFIETFEMLSQLADRMFRREGGEMVRLIDSTPVPLGKLFDWPKWNGRIRGLKLHVVYDPQADNPTRIAITGANVNDVEFGREVPLQAGFTYVYDKAFCLYSWWVRIHEAAAHFITRQKTSARFRMVHRRPLKKRKGDGFTVLEDADVKLVSKGDSKLPIPMRRIKIKREDGGKLTLLTNDLDRSAVEIAALYKARWQIELLFRWIKQHLKIKKFLARNEHAVKLQILAAMIAYLLLRIAARESRLKMPAIRFAELVADRLFLRRAIAQIDKPPEVHPPKAQLRTTSDQMEFCYA